MSEQAPTKDLSLETLKWALERIPPKPDGAVVDTVSDLRYHRNLAGWSNLRAEAWRTAFEWHTSLARRARTDFSQSLQELADGMALIREKLQ